MPRHADPPVDLERRIEKRSGALAVAQSGRCSHVGIARGLPPISSADSGDFSGHGRGAGEVSRAWGKVAAGLNLRVPDHTTLSRRGQHLDVNLHHPPRAERLHLLIDSTGLSTFGEGEWAAAKHGGHGTRGWRKLHLGVNRSTAMWPA